ncbi:MAG: hypothetical protein M1379_04215 [Firmicutes bacterium]|nr:hypothetical protein [Bacillota bacterium]
MLRKQRFGQEIFPTGAPASRFVVLAPVAPLTVVTVVTLIVTLVLAAVAVTTMPVLAATNDDLVGARPMGMGGAFAAVADDSTAVYWNPAGLVQLPAGQITSMYANKFGIKGYNFMLLNGAFPIRGAALGFGVIQEGVPLEEENGGVIVTNNFGERTVSLSGAGKFPKFSIGTTIKHVAISSGVSDVPSPSWAGVDFGILGKPSDVLSAGFIAKNLISTRADGEALTASYRGGIAYTGIRNVVLAADLSIEEDPTDHNRKLIKYHVGGEYRIFNLVTLRGGYDYKYLTAGLGLEKGRFSFDYAYQDHEANGTHRVSASFRF